jgi:hypothetical protein
MDRATRIDLLEQAAAELLESETNASFRIGVPGFERAGLVITALGSSVIVGMERGGLVLLRVDSLHPLAGRGPRAIAAGCERTLRTIHGLGDDFAVRVAFDNAANAARFPARLR